MIIQTDDKSYVRDTSSMLLSNVNQSEKDAYYNRRSILKQQKKAIGKLQEEVDGIKTELSEIKDLLKMLVEHK